MNETSSFRMGQGNENRLGRISNRSSGVVQSCSCLWTELATADDDGLQGQFQAALAGEASFSRSHFQDAEAETVKIDAHCIHATFEAGRA